MTWCNNESVEQRGIELITPTIIPRSSNNVVNVTTPTEIRTTTCPSCGYNIEFQDQGGIQDYLPGLPAGVKFDPNEQEILEHLEAKVMSDVHHVPKLHPLIDQFIPTLDGENGICYTHPEKLPGLSKDGQIRHFFHRPSKAYTTGTRKRRKVHTDEEGSETRWHKTGKTRPIFVGGAVKGFKKILVLYTNYGRQKKPEKTNWVMHQYHLGTDEEEKEGELVVSKIFYQTQPRQCANNSIIRDPCERRSVTQRSAHDDNTIPRNNTYLLDYYNPSFMNYEHLGPIGDQSSPQFTPDYVVQGDTDTSSFNIRLAVDANKARMDRKY